MSDAEHDPVVRRAIDELRKVPPADAATVRRVVAAAAAARVSPADGEPMLGDIEPRRFSVRLWTVAGIAAAAAFVGFGLSSLRHTRSQADRPTVAAAELPPLTPVTSRSTDAAPVSKQFVFNSRTAHRVSVVGDFNGWKSDSAPLKRSLDGDLWSVTIPIMPGRHTYGFMVDDVFVLDPRALKTRDADLGADASVIVVVKP